MKSQIKNKMNSWISLFIVILIPELLLAQNIHQAALAGDLDVVKEILVENPKLASSLDSDGILPAQYASWGNHEEATRFIISKMEDINVENNRGQSVLFYAVYRGQADIVDELIQQGAEFNKKDKPGRYPIHFAAREGHEEVVDVLIKNKVDINVYTADGWTPLTWSVNRGHLRIAEILLESGAVYQKDGDELITLLNDAARHGFEELVNQLFNEDIKIDPSDENKHELMFSAATGGLEDMIDRLVDIGIPVNSTNIYGSTPLHEAVRNNHLQVVKQLLIHGAEIDASQPDGTRPIDIARKNDSQAVIKLLERKGANTDSYRFPVISGKYLGETPPNWKAKIFAPGIISTINEDELIGFFNSGESIIYYSIPSDFEETSSEFPIYNIYLENGKWSQPEMTDHLGKPWFYNLDSIRSDTCFIYAEWIRNEEGNRTDLDIFKQCKTSTGWSEPEEFDTPINSDRYDSWPTVAGNGNLYFFSSRANGHGLTDIYCAELKDGTYSKVYNMGEHFNSSDDDHDPVVDPDDRFLIFNSNRPEGFGGDDLYISFREEDGNWSKPLNLGKKINSEFDDNRPYLTSDKKYLFFTRNTNGHLDVYWVDTSFIREKQPQ